MKVANREWKDEYHRLLYERTAVLREASGGVQTHSRSWLEAGLFLGQLHYRELFYVYAAISLVLGVYLTYGGFKSRSH